MPTTTSSSSTKRRRGPLSLSHGRPRPQHFQTTRTSAPSSRVTRTTIRKHHQLHKALARAQSIGDTALVASLTAQIDAEGGLLTYQAASLTGQSKERGGDTSKTLVGWFRELCGEESLERVQQNSGFGGTGTDENTRTRRRRLKMLDVGALSTDTAAGRCGAFEIERIDLHSQGKGILEQDFMQKPLPGTGNGVGPEEKFDIVCLSLVVNYVPDAKMRGEMLRRARHFLVAPTMEDGDVLGSGARRLISIESDGDHALNGDGAVSPFPALFVVLPAPCITNSRYLDEHCLIQTMASLGLALTKWKVSAKLAYSLWKWNGRYPPKVAFPKKEIVSGKNRNNFAIVLE